MDVDPKRLGTLLAVARNGGVVAAADELRVSPSAISQQLTKLEQEVGQALVLRTTRGTTLTSAGLTMAQAAEDIERVMATALLAVDRPAGPDGTMRVGAFSSFLRSVLVPSLADWRARFPRIQVELVEGDLPQLGRLLRRGELDVLVVELDASGDPPDLPPGVIEEPLLDEPWRLVVPAGTVLRDDSVDLDRLAVPWLGVDEASASSAAANRLRRGSGSGPTTLHRYYETTTALALVAAGEGMALVPALALGESVPDGVDVLDLHGLGTRRIVMRSITKRANDAMVRAARELIHEAVAAVDLEGRSSHAD
ncbi:LysR family transcriptional regulator [Aeromicrobium fastidiosum]|uniref:LysR family transcriptional regulator n=1 Tax=Aeromicrobium fastidiosum TaxID=52699 RepID=A0A641AIS3_9ACTN|nr:LysR family transcriptional regulator [Aeromicrobium fastidiosum]KAA1373558.1 LysR family transcriptional regulator [Aeromicrobium fastidiosum]MBP2391101.1 DNA-binding transcriptional LysR family regulator [Aeromicrobium fastidiosum]